MQVSHRTSFTFYLVCTEFCIILFNISEGGFNRSAVSKIPGGYCVIKVMESLARWKSEREMLKR